MEEFEKWFSENLKYSLAPKDVQIAWEHQQATINELENSNKALLKKIASLSAHETCACSFDNEVDVCLHHSPQLTQKTDEVKALRNAITDIFGWLDESDIAIKSALLRHGLIDENGSPTKLLKGE